MSDTITSASSIQADYMKLLVEQLKNQDPLDPVNNSEMASQLAQFSQLQQLESMNSSFSKVLSTTELMYANSAAYIGTVGRAYKDSDGAVVLSVGDYAIGLDDVIAVQD
jgi:flagellar hook assembly protein FlgD